ncbi:hypothetical protein ACOMHN_058347 [Nucella lapillus]
MIMSVKMANVRVVLAVLASCLAASCVGQKLMVTHAPSYVSLHQQTKPLSASDMPNVIADTLGLSDSPKAAWTGLKSGSLFKRPKANVLLTVVTVKSSDQEVKPQHKAAFPVDADLPLLDLSPVMNRIQSSFLDHDPLMLDLMADANSFDLHTPNEVFRKLPNSLRSLADRLLDRDSMLSRVSAGSLNRSHSPDLSLMAELQMVDHVLNTLKQGEGRKNGKAPDLFSFVISGLPAVSQAHGPHSQQTKDAHTMVSQFIDAVTEDFKQLYKDNVVVEVLSVPAPEKPLVRRARSLMQAATTAAPPAGKDYNLAWDYPDDFPAMFNIILWMVVILGIAVFIIAYGMWNIDPGRDSIIYRMTSQRLKKD